MTVQEKWETIDEVCKEICKSLQKEADRLKQCAEKWDKENDPGMKRHCLEKATTMVEAQINVNATAAVMKIALLKTE